MRVLGVVAGVLVALVVVFLGMATTGLHPVILGLAAVVLGAVFAAGPWALPNAWPRVGGSRWYLWAVISLVAIVGALGAQGTANEGCPGTDSVLRRVLVSLALAGIGVGALSFPAIEVRRLFRWDAQPLRSGIGLLVLSVVWLLLWVYLWFVVWRVTLDCVG